MSKSRICAKVSHHITAFFVPVWSSDPETTGSQGAGVLVGPKALICLSKNFKGDTPELVKLVVKELYGRISKPSDHEGIEISEPLPVGYGYASSAALALGAALVLSISGGFPLSKAVRAAHIAELRARTGLGDVQAIYYAPVGSVVVRVRAGIKPGESFVELIPIPTSISVISLVFGRMETQELLQRYSDLHQREALKALNSLLQEPSFENFVALATSYTRSTGMLKELSSSDPSRIEGLIAKTPGLLGFYVKKRIVVIFLEKDLLVDAIDYLRKKLAREPLVHYIPSSTIEVFTM